MIGSLRGKIILIAEDYILLEIDGGVGYMVHISSRHLASIAINDVIFLYIHTNVREDAITLYGFENAQAQSLFLLLCTVQGVGNKMALNVISTFSSTQLRDILIAQDINSLTIVSGVGKRLGERIITELKNKTNILERIFADNNAVQYTDNSNVNDEVIQIEANAKANAKSVKAKTSPKISLDNNLIKDATSALENLGYSKADAMRAAISAKANGATDLSEIITNALRLLG